MHAFDVLGDPVRRRILELIGDAQTSATRAVADADGVPAGSLAATVMAEFGITQPAVSRHLRVLRENGFAHVTVDGQRRLYALDSSGLAAVDEWLDRYRSFWTQRLDALDTELRRGRKARAAAAGGGAGQGTITDKEHP